MTKSQKIAIFGLGEEGVSAANYFAKTANILIYDDKNKEQIDKTFFKKLQADVSFYFQKDINEKVDIVIRSPGVRPDHPKIVKLLKKGAKLTSTTKIFFDKCPSQIIGVTGTKGKGTTVTLIYKMLKNKYKDVFLAGNIGTPMLEILPKIKKGSLVVLELSSFQLMDLTTSPHVAVVLMVTSEHLDWHPSQKEYHLAKLPVVKYQTNNDFAIVNQDFPISLNAASYTKAKVYFFSTAKEANGVYVKGGKLISQINGYEEICNTSIIKLAGKHNLQNVAAATAVAKILNIENKTIAKVLSTFKGLEHRLQLVRIVDGVKFYNDSFSTTPETTIAAIEAFTSPKILILGGSSKKSDFTLLAQKIKSDKSIQGIILIGEETPRIKKAITGFSGMILEGAKDMKEITATASKVTKPGDIVILSPACASFDMFKNYKDRGDQYIKAVRSLRQ